MYNKLKELLHGTRFKVKGEVRVPKKNGKRGARLDIVIFNKEQPLIIIEVKSRGNTPENELKQIQMYKALFNLPVFLCRGYEGISQTINRVQKITTNTC